MSGIRRYFSAMRSAFLGSCRNTAHCIATLGPGPTVGVLFSSGWFRLGAVRGDVDTASIEHC